MCYTTPITRFVLVPLLSVLSLLSLNLELGQHETSLLPMGFSHLVKQLSLRLIENSFLDHFGNNWGLTMPLKVIIHDVIDTLSSVNANGIPTIKVRKSLATSLSLFNQNTTLSFSLNGLSTTRILNWLISSVQFVGYSEMFYLLEGPVSGQYILRR